MKIVKKISEIKEIVSNFKKDKFSLEVGDELAPGIVQMAKVYVAKKLSLIHI